jgi:hypothetical protein
LRAASPARRVQLRNRQTPRQRWRSSALRRSAHSSPGRTSSTRTIRTFLANAAWNISGFIPVEEGQTYYVGYYAAPTRNVLGLSGDTLNWYDANKTFISQIASTSTPTAPPGAAFMRISGSSATRTNWSNITVTLGSGVPANWSTYQPPYQPNPYQGSTLRQTHYRLMKLALPVPEAAQLVVNIPGDSYSQKAVRWVSPFADFLIAKFGDAGGGYSGWGFATAGTTPYVIGGAQPSSIQGNARPSLYPVRYAGSPTLTYYSAPTPDLASVTLAAAGDAVEQDFPAAPSMSGINLIYVGTGACTARFGYGATQGALPSSWTTLTLNAASGTTTVVPLSLTGIAQPGTLRVEWQSGTCQLGGVDMKSAANGVRVNKIASTGSAVAQYATVNGTNWQTGFASLGGHLTIYGTGPNDQTGAVPGPGGGTFAANMSTMINRFRGATTGAPTSTAMDVLLVSPPENQRSNNTYAISEYSRVLRTLAYQARTAFLDMQPAFGDAGNPANYGPSGDVVLFNGDNLHIEDATGGRLYIAEILRPIMPFGPISMNVDLPRTPANDNAAERLAA